MKPRMKLVQRWFDCGWPYEWWSCWSIDGRKGAGSSPAEAYQNWESA